MARVQEAALRWACERLPHYLREEAYGAAVRKLLFQARRTAAPRRALSVEGSGPAGTPHPRREAAGGSGGGVPGAAHRRAAARQEALLGPSGAG